MIANDYFILVCGLLLALSLASAGAALASWLSLQRLMRVMASWPDSEERAEQRHRAIIADLYEGLAAQAARTEQAVAAAADRSSIRQEAASEHLRAAVASHSEHLKLSMRQELTETRQAMENLQRAQEAAFARQDLLTQRAFSTFAQTSQERDNALREQMVDKLVTVLTQQGQAGQSAIKDSLAQATQLLTTTINHLNETVKTRLEHIANQVGERLDEGFKKTNDTFTSVVTRLAVIDEAQKKMEGLTRNMVSLQQLLGDKRSRGAFGEVQLEHLVRNLLPEPAFRFQAVLSTGVRVDCLLHLPPPTGSVAVDAKFPLENYNRMFGDEESTRRQARSDFSRDIRRHVDAIASKYIIAGETADGAVMFVPAEAIFAEIHAYHEEVVQYAQQKRVWIVSPTTLMAVLNTARAVLRDAQMREQLHVMQIELLKLSEEFARFDKRMKNLATHIALAHKDVQEVHVTSQKITRRFASIEHVELSTASPPQTTENPDVLEEEYALASQTSPQDEAEL